MDVVLFGNDDVRRFLDVAVELVNKRLLGSGIAVFGGLGIPVGVIAADDRRFPGLVAPAPSRQFGAKRRAFVARTQTKIEKPRRTKNAGKGAGAPGKDHWTLAGFVGLRQCLTK